MTEPRVHVRFVGEGNETWFRIDGIEGQASLFNLLASDSDLWALVSTAGPLPFRLYAQHRAQAAHGR